MTSLTEQLSAVRQSQWNAQLDLINRLGSRTLDRSEQLIELNIKTSRASVEQAAGVVKQLLDVRAPRDLFALGAQAQDGWQQMFAYGRALMGIATGARDDVIVQAPALRLLPAPLADVPSLPSQAADQLVIAVADATTVAGEIAGAAADVGAAVAEAAVDAVEHAEPVAEPVVAPVVEAAKADVAATQDAVSDVVSDAMSDAVAAAESATASSADAATQAVDATASAAEALTTAPALVVEAHPAPDHTAEAALDAALADTNGDTALPAKAKPLVEALHDATHAAAGIAHPLAATLPPERPPARAALGGSYWCGRRSPPAAH